MIFYPTTIPKKNITRTHAKNKNNRKINREEIQNALKSIGFFPNEINKLIAEYLPPIQIIVKKNINCTIL
jgi:uncharacterized protein Smg (DUF494 family)